MLSSSVFAVSQLKLHWGSVCNLGPAVTKSMTSAPSSADSRTSVIQQQGLLCDACSSADIPGLMQGLVESTRALGFIVSFVLFFPPSQAYPSLHSAALFFLF